MMIMMTMMILMMMMMTDSDDDDDTIFCNANAPIVIRCLIGFRCCTVCTIEMTFLIYCSSPLLYLYFVFILCIGRRGFPLPLLSSVSFSTPLFSFLFSSYLSPSPSSSDTTVILFAATAAADDDKDSMIALFIAFRTPN